MSDVQPAAAPATKLADAPEKILSGLEFPPLKMLL